MLLKLAVANFQVILKLTCSFYFPGGVPDVKMINEMYTEMFKGCISNVRTSAYENERKSIDLFKDAVKYANVTNRC